MKTYLEHLWRYVLVLCTLSLTKPAGALRLVDLDTRLSELVTKSPDRNWLVKFYAPSCYYCKLIGPTYEEVASKLHDIKSNVIVGRVDCTKYPIVCQDFKIPAYPTILFLKNDLVIQYEGDRSAESMTAFARRLEGPDTRTIDSCDQLESLKAQLGVIVISTLKDGNNRIQQKFSVLSKKLKAKYWFYRIAITCEMAQLDEEGLYILKSDLMRPIKLSMDHTKVEEADIVDWLSSNSVPVFTEVHRMNIESIISRSSLLVLAILEMDETNKVLSPKSEKIYDNFRRLSINHAQTSENVAHGWTSDVELARSIVIDHISLPNIILVKPDFSFHLIADHSQTDKLLAKFEDQSISQIIQDAQAGKLEFVNTDNFITNCRRNVLKFIRNVRSLYNSNPFLAIFMFGVPTIAISFVIYTFCFMEGETGRDYEDEDEDDDDDDDYIEDEALDMSSDKDQPNSLSSKLVHRRHHDKQD